VSDLVDGIVRLFLHPDTGPSTDAGVGDHGEGASDIHLPVNIGNPVEFTVMDLARKVIELTGSQSEIQHHPLPVDDPQVRQPDISRAQRVLRWEPVVALNEGLKKTIAYFRTEV